MKLASEVPRGYVHLPDCPRVRQLSGTALTGYLRDVSVRDGYGSEVVAEFTFH
jgi:hypothetical protein